MRDARVKLRRIRAAGQHAEIGKQSAVCRLLHDESCCFRIIGIIRFTDVVVALRTAQPRLISEAHFPAGNPEPKLNNACNEAGKHRGWGVNSVKIGQIKRSLVWRKTVE